MLTRSVFPRLGNDGASFRRDKFLIISNILLLAMDGMKKTELMYKAGLSSYQFGKYLPMLSRSELLETLMEKKKTLYKTTEKGKNFLHTFEVLVKMLD